MNERGTNSETGVSVGRSGPAGPSQAGSSHGRSHHRSRSQKKILKLLVTSWILGGLLVATIFGWVLLASSLAAKNDDIVDYKGSLREERATVEQLSGEVNRLEEEMAALRVQLDELVRGRIPNLQPLEFDVTVASDQRYFKNISFTLTGTQTNKRYEYRVVLNNDSTSTVRPHVTIFLFDSFGAQVEARSLTLEDATSDVETSGLKPGETRAYSNHIDLARDAEPSYFLVEVN